ncbi:possible Nucleoside diphosphate kinase [Prochlorococcus marinus subsp. pastoris str. CCMP1986]|uniref:Possible Nucleoside diphosphate kinase n=1 Tax=Prochlorococcus marinus subsp. pastoris (strain CCMP1986 / NIES-2087 / MED4) TaxID=59919 RepID=Q7TUA4_PROMP|nr:possible Nucleoside diphosphate kinase [Prochlorococcus marinus subsp. pastoris str. CCMP1986]
MADLKIPNLNKNSDKYFFKKKLSLRRKSKSKLINESFIMIFFSALIFYLIYLIPNKISIFKNLFINFSKLFANFLDSISYIYEICLSIFIIFSLIFSLILFIGSFSRILKVVKRKTSRLNLK